MPYGIHKLIGELEAGVVKEWIFIIHVKVRFLIRIALNYERLPFIFPGKVL